MAQKPSIPKGTRDFSPAEMTNRNYIFDTIKSIFRLYGFQPIETPAMENLSTLMGKYGEEGDKLLFKILNSGDFAAAPSDQELLERNSIRLTNKISEKGLRYDLTVPFARFVVQYRNDISFPFKRYQIQPVWRADRPQKGRYREFYQCDVDVVGSNSLLNEVELIQIVDSVFEKFGLPVIIKINNRKILGGIAEVIGAPDKMIDIAIAIDKYDKIGKEGVIQELKEKGFDDAQILKLQDVFFMHSGKIMYGQQSDIDNDLKFLKDGSEFRHSTLVLKGVEELEIIFKMVKDLKIKTEIKFDVTLARGLNYYTGAIFEVKAKDVAMGSICGGGRYDDLTGIFGMPNVSGVGISFGADRIYDVLTQLELFPAATADSTKLMFVNFGAAEEAFCLPVLAAVRKAGINAEIFPDKSKMGKQMTWANNKKIPFVAIVGESEMAQGKINLKNMLSGDQQLVDPQELIKILSE